MRTLISFLLKLILFLTLPFIVLIRGAIHLHEYNQYPPSLSLLGGIFLATLLLTIYLIFFRGQLTGEVGSIRTKLWLALFLVIGYGAHGLFFFSDANSKSSQVQKEFRELHPILRVSISTLIHLDPSLIVTDANRHPEDYRKMGMSSKKHSLHYRPVSYTHLTLPTKA